MKEYISGIFLDFDNIYGSLNRIDPAAAIGFANSPGLWVKALEDMRGKETEDTFHRFVIRRCYINTKGRIGSGPEFGEYRQNFVRDGWEVIDTPALTKRGKSSADIHIVMDVLDTILLYPHVEEYLIMAADADFTPLVTRLRKHMKTTIVYESQHRAAAYVAACDSVINELDFVSLVVDKEEDTHEDGTLNEVATAAAVEAPVEISIERVKDRVRRYFAESTPGHKAPVGSVLSVLKKDFGTGIDNFLGYKSLSQLLRYGCGLKVEKVDTRTVASLEEADIAKGESDQAQSLSVHSL